MLTIFIFRIAHELTRALYNFRKEGVLETVGPAGLNAMNTSYVYSLPSLNNRSCLSRVNTMVDAMTAMERIANTPIPKSCEHCIFTLLDWAERSCRWHSFEAVYYAILVLFATDDGKYSLSFTGNR